MEKDQKTHSYKSPSFFRAHQGLIAAGCVIILAVFIIQLVYMRQRESVFLRSARLESSATLPARTDYQYWTDILKYTDGCEIMTFQPDQAGAWAAPAEWVKEQVPLRTLAERFGISIHPNCENIMNPDSTVCDAWYVQALSGESVPFHQREYWLCFHDPVHFRITVYRGHHLYGLSSLCDVFLPCLDLIRQGREEELAAFCANPDLAHSILLTRKQLEETFANVLWDDQLKSLKIFNNSAEIRLDVTLSAAGKKLYDPDHLICFERKEDRWMITKYWEHP